MRLVIILTLVAGLQTGLFCISSAQPISQTEPYDTIALEDNGFDDYFVLKQNIPVVKGRILNLPDSLVGKLTIQYAFVVPTSEGQLTKKCIADSTGSYTLQLDYAFPYQEIWLTVGERFYTRLMVKKDLFIQIDYQKLPNKKVWMYGKGVEYQGYDAALCEWTGRSIKYFKNNDRYETTISKQYLSENFKWYERRHRTKELVSVFKSRMDTILLRRLGYLQAYLGNHPEAEKYRWIIKHDIENDIYKETLQELIKLKYNDTVLTDMLSRRKTYTMTNNGMRLKEQLLDVKHLSAAKSSAVKAGDLIHFIDFMMVNLPDSSQAERTKLAEYRKKAEELAMGNRKGLRQMMRMLRVLQKLADEYGEELSAYLAGWDLAAIDSMAEKSQQDIYKLLSIPEDYNMLPIFQARCALTFNNRWAALVLEKSQAEFKQRNFEIYRQVASTAVETAPLQTDIPFEQHSGGSLLYKDESLSGREILSLLLKTYKGKAILIDFWATWCSPCIEDLPYSHNLHAKMANDDIGFVYLCSQSPEDKWRSRIRGLGLGGAHFLLSETQSKQLMNLFHVTAFPSYILIDPNGHYKRALPLSMQEMTPEYIKKSLKE